jgi:hypothetical protein
LNRGDDYTRLERDQVDSDDRNARRCVDDKAFVENAVEEVDGACAGRGMLKRHATPVCADPHELSLATTAEVWTIRRARNREVESVEKKRSCRRTESLLLVVLRLRKLQRTKTRGCRECQRRRGSLHAVARGMSLGAAHPPPRGCIRVSGFRRAPTSATASERKGNADQRVAGRLKGRPPPSGHWLGAGRRVAWAHGQGRINVGAAPHDDARLPTASASVPLL